MVTTGGERKRRERGSRARSAPVNPIVFDLAQLEAAAFRDSPDDAVVSRHFLRDVVTAVRNPALIRLIHPGDAATPVAIA